MYIFKQTYPFMKYLLFLFILVLASCNGLPADNKALKIVHESIEAHGGFEYWKSIDRIKFRKETKLFLEDGTIEKDVIEIHTLNQRDTLFGNIVNTDSISENKYEIKFADGVGEKISNAGTTDGTNSFLSSHFVVNQPFKLLDPGVSLNYEGQDTLASGKVVDVVKAYYGDPNDDIWWFYFDQKSHIVLATLIYHSPTYAFVDNEVIEKVDGILWNLKRTTYRTDSLRNIEYVRAKFVYEVLETSF